MAVYPEQRLPWLIWGDGSQGQLLSRRDVGPDENGVKMTEIRFRPTEELMANYGFPRQDLDNEYSLTLRFPSSQILILSDDPVNSTILIMCDVKLRDTKLTLLNSHLLETLTGYEKLIKSLRAQNAWLHAENQRMMSHVNEYVKRNSELFLTAIKVRGEIDSSGQAMIPSPPQED